MKMCSKCKQRPAVVFLADPMNANSEPMGYCLTCAKELGIRQVDAMLEKMNITDDDIEMMNDQLMSLMDEDAELNDETFDLGTAPAFPFLNNLFGDSAAPATNEEAEKSEDKKEKPKKKKRRFEVIWFVFFSCSSMFKLGFISSSYFIFKSGRYFVDAIYFIFSELVVVVSIICVSCILEFCSSKFLDSFEEIL